MPSNPTSNLSKESIKTGVTDMLRAAYRKTIQTATPQQIYNALALTIKEHVSANWLATHEHFKNADVKFPGLAYFFDFVSILYREMQLAY